MNILITGGASGLGEAITKTLATDSSNNVYFTYCKSKENAEEIEGKFKNTKGIFCDFEDHTSIQSLLVQMDELKLHVLINNALTGLKKEYFHKIQPEYFSENFSRNILPVIKITQKAILLFRKQKFGKIITVISAYIATKPAIGLSEYVAQKNYLFSLSKSWAVENSRHNITSNCISPSYMQTHLNSDTDDRVLEDIINSHPLKKLLTPEEVAESVSHLVNASQQINGVNLIINSAIDII